MAAAHFKLACLSGGMGRRGEVFYYFRNRLSAHRPRRLNREPCLGGYHNG
jgi:hypothetical protein